MKHAKKSFQFAQTNTCHFGYTQKEVNIHPTNWKYWNQKHLKKHRLISQTLQKSWYTDTRDGKILPPTTVFVLVNNFTFNYKILWWKFQQYLALFQHGKYNVISLDFNRLAKSPCYLQAVQNAVVVANCTAQLIDVLVANLSINMDQIHIIGFSLGAHVAGMTAMFLKSGKIARITGCVFLLNRSLWIIHFCSHYF